MTTMAFRPTVTDAAADLRLRRSDIDFRNDRPDRIGIDLIIRNPTAAYSRGTEAEIHAAPLGAFVAWHPLTTVRIPPIPAGAGYRLRASARYQRPVPLGDPARDLPRTLLTAQDYFDRRPLPPQGMAPADPMHLLGRGGAHWAGNLNVFVGTRPVERHMARGLRIHAGRVNMAAFVTGAGADAYAFSLSGDGATWDAQLFDIRGIAAGGGRPDGPDPLEPEAWIELNGPQVLLLAITPPAGVAEGSVDVHVSQRSTGDEAVVEFSLDVNAEGPGCFVI